MAIKIEQKEEGTRLIADIDNGHVEALKKIAGEYNIEKIEDVIGFMLSVFVNGNGKPIEIDGETYVPSKKILKKEHGKE